MKKIRLKNKQIDYPILIGSNLYKDIGTISKKYLEKNRVFVVSDSIVYDLYKNKILNSFKKSKIECIFIPITVSEKKKNINTVASLSTKIMGYGVDRKDTVIALGGGILGDIVGFTASIILRGINYIQLPTTLLAQVDSSVGGKTGVNNNFGKNLLGSFYQPKLVVIDTDVLRTLPKRELLSGYAEIIKYGIIKDAKFFHWLQKNGSKVIDGNTDARIYAIYRSCINKSQIVEDDEKEHGTRALLNLGHTFGHAIESLNDYKKNIIHGEAVSIGIIIATKLSYIDGNIDKNTCDQIINHFAMIGLKMYLPQSLKKIPPKKFIAEMLKDKKTINNEMTLILIQKIGKAFIKKKYSYNRLIKLFKEITT